MPRLVRRVWFWAPPFLYMAVIFYLSSQSAPLPALTAAVWDKALHTIEYGGLGFLLARALRSEGAGWWAAIISAIVLTSAYGASDEWHQSFVPMRDADVRDWIADTIGATVGVVVFGAFEELTRITVGAGAGSPAPARRRARDRRG